MPKGLVSVSLLRGTDGEPACFGYLASTDNERVGNPVAVTPVNLYVALQKDTRGSKRLQAPEKEMGKPLELRNYTQKPREAHPPKKVPRISSRHDW